MLSSRTPKNHRLPSEHPSGAATTARRCKCNAFPGRRDAPRRAALHGQPPAQRCGMQQTLKGAEAALCLVWAALALRAANTVGQRGAHLAPARNGLKRSHQEVSKCRVDGIMTEKPVLEKYEDVVSNAKQQGCFQCDDVRKRTQAHAYCNSL